MLSKKQTHPRLGQVINRQDTNSGGPGEREEEQGFWSQGTSLEKEDRKWKLASGRLQGRQGNRHSMNVAHLRESEPMT